jgi:spore germination protein GerM
VSLLASVFGVALLLSSCGVPAESSPRVVSEEELPAGLRTLDTAPDATSQEQQIIDVWFVRDETLVSSRHRVPTPVEPTAVVEEILAGPTETEQNASLRSAIPDPAAVVGVTLARGVATVELSAAFAEIPANDQVLAVGQIVLTLTDLRGLGRVRFVVDDTNVAVPLATGETSDQSVSRDDYLVLTGS